MAFCPSNPVGLSRMREEGGHNFQSKAAAAFLDPLNRANEHQMRWKSLTGHQGCVNALAFSLSGSYLFSGGDDSRVFVWNPDAAAYADQNPKPLHVMDGKHGSNVFCLDSDCTETRVVSGGNDWNVLVHDLPTLKTTDVFVHEDAVYGISYHPTSSQVFATACSDGRTQIFDLRMPKPPVDQDSALCLVSSSGKPFLSVQFNPTDERLVLTTQDSALGAALWDVRSVHRPLVRYKGNRTAMFARFNSAGTQVLVLTRRRSPCLYDLWDGLPRARFDSPYYYNNCTMKSGCFGGIRDDYVLAGSDDFNLYAWKIPEEKEETTVARATFTLSGHKSIVNQVRCRAEDGLIASSGVEKSITLWSAAPMPESRDIPTYEENLQRIHESRISANGFVLIPHGLGNESPNRTEIENPRMLGFFDRLIEHELKDNICMSSSSSSASSAATSGDGADSTSNSSTSSSSESSISDSVEGHVKIAKLIVHKRKMLERRRKKRRRLRPVRTRFLTQMLMRPSSSSDDEDVTKPTLSSEPSVRVLYSDSSSSSENEDPSTSSRRQSKSEKTEVENENSDNETKHIHTKLKPDSVVVVKKGFKGKNRKYRTQRGAPSSSSESDS